MPVRESFRSLLLLLAATALSAALVEGVLRWAHFGSLRLPERGEATSLRIPHPTRGWALAPGRSVLQSTRDYSVRVAINSKGLRDVEHDYEAAAGAFRIVVLGDSFMEAYQVTLEESFPRRLERRLAERRVEVINLGVGGYGTTQQLLYLREEGLEYRPDLVLLAFLPDNDIRNNSRALESALWGESTLKTFGRPFAVEEASGKLRIDEPDYRRSLDLAAKAARRGPVRPPWWRLDNSVTWRLISRLARARRESAAPVPTYDPNILFGPHLEGFDPSLGRSELDAAEYARLWDEATRITQRLIGEIETTARSAGAGFAMFLVPGKIHCSESFRGQVGDRYPSLRFDTVASTAAWLRFGEARGISVIDLVTPFAEAERSGTGTLFHRHEDRHWNGAGHRLAAAVVAERLESLDLVSAPVAGGR